MILKDTYPLAGAGAPFMLPGFDTSKYKMHDTEDYKSIQFNKKFIEHTQINKK